MSELIDPARLVVSFIFAITRKMPGNRAELERIPAVSTQVNMLAQRFKAEKLVSKELYRAITTYRPSVFVDHPQFALAVQAAQKHGTELVVADPFSFMRNLDIEAALRCMRILDALPIGVTNAHDGRPWASYATPEKQRLYLTAKSATAAHGNRIKRHLPEKGEPTRRVTAQARERAGATLSKNADRRALELKIAIERIRNDAGGSELSPTAVANELNKLGHATARGYAWSTTTAKRLLHRLEKLQADAPMMDQKQR